MQGVVILSFFPTLSTSQIFALYKAIQVLFLGQTSVGEKEEIDIDCDTMMLDWAEDVPARQNATTEFILIAEVTKHKRAKGTY